MFHSQVHEIHPSHAFLVVPERPRIRSEPIVEKEKIDPSGEEPCMYPQCFSDDYIDPQPPSAMVHPGVKCAQ